MDSGLVLIVNGVAREVAPPPGRSLLRVLREQLGLVAAKPGCGEGVCGACTVLVAGEPVRSCVLSVEEVGERPVTTLEGLAPAGTLHPLQLAIRRAGCDAVRLLHGGDDHGRGGAARGRPRSR